MSRWWVRLGWCVWLCSASIHPAFGEECTAVAAGEGEEIQKYANECFKKLGIDPAEFAKTFNCVDPDVAKHLKVEVDGAEVKTCLDTREGECQWAKDKAELEATFKTCDYPAWLDDRCYGDSYIQVLTTSKPEVKGALLCRHKSRFTGLFDDFDDVAMIVHNRASGETCWFQSNNADGDPDIKMHGQQVPGPACEGSESFWYSPEASRNVYCIHCHDSGPWMNSRWMRRATESLGSAYEEETSPYLNSTPPFDAWPVPIFVKYNKHLKEKDGTEFEGCTDCHKIAAARTLPGAAVDGSDIEYKTCDTWINRTTGKPDDPLKALLTEEAKKDHVQYWMPDGVDLSKADWEKKYRKHVDGLIACCKAVGKGPNRLPDGCKAYCPDQADGKCPADRWPSS